MPIAIVRVFFLASLLVLGLIADTRIRGHGRLQAPGDADGGPSGQALPPAAGAERAPPRLIFGLGPAAQSAMSYKLNQDAILGMYTTWYNKPEDLEWMSDWRESTIPAIYASGRAAHLVIWSDVPEGGTPCGRPYPISDGINGDMEALARIWAGTAADPPLYVTLFTEFQTFPCIDNQWLGAEEYYGRLQRKMVEIKDIFHRFAPNARVSIGWGGWQLRWDDTSDGAGRSLLKHFDSVMRQMDFQSFQAMHDEGNANDVRAMTRALGPYGPVMLAHYKPQHQTVSTYIEDISIMLTEDFLADLSADGLFAWSFMDTAQMSRYPGIYESIRDAVTAYGRQP